jgi:hypothetical protein
MGVGRRMHAAGHVATMQFVHVQLRMSWSGKTWVLISGLAHCLML